MLLLAISGGLINLCSAEETRDFTLQDIQQHDALLAEVNALTPGDKLKWYRQQIENNSGPTEFYWLNRAFALELLKQGDLQSIKPICSQSKPLDQDFLYRHGCLEASEPSYSDYQIEMQSIIFEAQNSEQNSIAARLFRNLAWRQSQEGDFGAAFTSYETALEIVPSDDSDLVNSLLFDSASNYIAHGDDAYVERGVKLLNRVRKNYEELLAVAETDDDRKHLTLQIQFAYFNIGVAHILHLYQYDKALDAFKKVNNANNALSANSLTYSALAAANLSRIDEAQGFLQRAKKERDGDPVFDQYLSCYRHLAEYFWNKNVSFEPCFNLYDNTSVEVKIDIYKRLSDVQNKEVQIFALEQLKALFVNVLEPKLRSRASAAASNLELKRLQRESELKSLVLEKEQQLNIAKNARFTAQRNFFIALFFILLFFLLLVYFQFRQKRQLAEQYHQMSFRDSLTQLGNRRLLEHNVQRELATVSRNIQQGKTSALGIFIFDIDHFKQINDTYGHNVGDEVLQQLSRRIHSTIRETDLLVRWGGEEFVCLAQVEDKSQTLDIANRILKVVNSVDFMVGDGLELPVSCTIGIVQYPFVDTDNQESWTRLISLADSALYYGKSLGRDCWVMIENVAVSSYQEVEELLTKPLAETINKGIVTVTSSKPDLNKEELN